MTYRRKPIPKTEQEFDQRVIDIARVTRVMKGGKRMSFRATLGIGDKKGRVGIGIAKGKDVSVAIQKAFLKAKKNLIKVPLTKGTIPHEVRVKFKSAKLLLKPAKQGTGIKAGGAVRILFELAGIGNISAKILGTNNKLNNVKAAILALSSFKTKSKKGKKESSEEKKKKNTNIDTNEVAEDGTEDVDEGVATKEIKEEVKGEKKKEEVNGKKESLADKIRKAITK